MKKGEILSLAIQAINGQTNSDSLIRMNRVAVYLPAAVGYVAIVQYRNQLRDNGTKDMAEDFFVPYQLPVQKASSGRMYVDLPVRYLSFPQNRGLRYVGPLTETDKYIVQAEGASILYKHYDLSMDDVTRVRPEGKRLWITNLPLGVKEVIVRLLPNPADLVEDDEIPLPLGFEVDVIDLIVKFFTGQKQVPKDFIADNKDIVSGNRI